jgi:hypothetical protein
MRASTLQAVMVVQDVRAGFLVASAASEPEKLDVTTPVLALSLSKLMPAASRWDNHQPDSSLRVTPHEMLVDGSDSAGRQMALALRASVGTEAVLRDFDRYGFQTLLAAGTKDAEWADTLSIGEINM